MKEKISRILKFIWTHKVRITLSAALIATLFVTPLLTQAQYYWKLNGFTIVQAKEFYFQSNSMKDISKHAEVSTGGWNGISNPIKDIEIRNYENTLLANKEGEDAEYVFTWEIETYIATPNGDGTFTYASATDDQKYDIGVVNVERAYNDVDHPFPYAYGQGEKKAYGKIIGDGTPRKDVYTFSIVPPSSGIQPYNSYIKVTLNASNVELIRDASENVTEHKDTDSFSRQLSCVLYYYITTTSGFITSFDTVEIAEYRDLDLNIGTGKSPDMTGESQTATIWWDNRKLDINPFCQEFSKALEYRPQYSDDLPWISSVTIGGLGSVATRNLKFKKKDWSDGTTEWNKYDIWFTEGEEGTKTRFLAKNIKPEELTTEGNEYILGYYVQEIDGSGGNTGGAEGGTGGDTNGND